MAVDAGPASFANPRGLMLDLFCDGARAAAPEPRTLTDAALDEDGGQVTGREVVLSRVGWYVGAAPVVLRLLVLPAATIVLIGVYGLGPLLPLAVVVALLGGADALGLLRAAQRKGLEPRLLPVAFALAVAANLLVAATVQASLFSLATAVTGAYLVTTVILWTLAWGGLARLVLVAANVPLQAAIVALNHANDPVGVPHALQGDRLQRLQQPESAAADPEQTLRHVRGMARSQVIQTRRAPDELAAAGRCVTPRVRHCATRSSTPGSTRRRRRSELTRLAIEEDIVSDRPTG